MNALLTVLAYLIVWVAAGVLAEFAFDWWRRKRRVATRPTLVSPCDIGEGCNVPDYCPKCGRGGLEWPSA